MKTVKAQIKWLFDIQRIPPVISEENRKKHLSYSPIIIIKGQYISEEPYVFNKYPVWSSVIFNDQINKNESLATLTYFAETAPFQLLIPGVEFYLYEGPNKVAEGIIIK